MPINHFCRRATAQAEICWITFGRDVVDRWPTPKGKWVEPVTDSQRIPDLCTALEIKSSKKSPIEAI
ncbi:hypothetical protein T265_10403 [Opisthorchis viverrini]|uniref:Uncharacterized protein n=1 Tax=Opisthorchis viverrini TaxID=6198 RepID=A0A074ZDE1_OPIVI|nr:hypothetical protein T265_10403 [Opisthorchis viverrini]KER21215.1 hypothetical protein T265_10403 [Opisthorchis viverrini]